MKLNLPVFVKAKNIDKTGIISRRVAIVPKLQLDVSLGHYIQAIEIIKRIDYMR